MGAPLYEALLKQAEKKRLRFCMPGHKDGVLFDGEKIYKMDTTELADTDNLHWPSGVISEAQRLAACAFGAKRSYFLINGSSCGIMAMFAATLNPESYVLIDRNCHLSVIHALAFCGAKAQFLSAPYSINENRFDALIAENVSRALDDNPNIKAVFVTSPSYYGICHDLSALVQVAHEHGAYLLVDEAHGAHFAFSERLPQTALECGADLTVQSVHKTLPALTQSAILHVGNENLIKKIEPALRLFQTTSPSYLLMSHIDRAREIMQSQPQRLEQLIDWIEEIFGISPSNDKDVTRLRFHFDNMTGFEASDWLFKKNILVEMADITSVVCILTVADTKEGLIKLKKAVDEIAALPGKRPQTVKFPCHTPRFKTGIRQAFFGEAESVPLCHAVGMTVKEAVVVYPPGVPTLIPGAVITGEDIQYIKRMRELGAEVHGLDGECVRCLKRP